MKIKLINEADSTMAYRTKGAKNMSNRQPAPVAAQAQAEKEEKQAIQNADRILDNPEEVSNPDQIKDTLNKLLKKNKNEIKHGTYNFQNVLFVGPAGTGKTSRIKAWAAENNINLVTVIASSMDETDLGGILSKDEEDPGTVKKLSSKEFDALDNVPNSVLFLDEFNRAPHSVRGPLLSLIQDHIVRDDRLDTKERRLKHFLFTIAAINPADENYNTDQLDDAEMSRFRVKNIYHDNINTRDYLIKSLQKKIDSEMATDNDPETILEYRGQQKLANVLLSSPDFEFDSPADVEASKMNGNGLILTSRTLTNAIEGSDGTKEDFLDGWNDYCNSLKKSMVIDILSGYEDVQDEATAALDGHQSQSRFVKKQSAWDKLSSLGI